LKGHPESYADLNIGSKQLDNPGLWGGETVGFRPWYWPVLPKYLDSFKKKVGDIKGNLNEPICRFLGIPKEIVEILPRTVGEFIGDYPHETTFKEFIAKSGNGLRGKDNEAIDEMGEEAIERIVVARISKWLERLVLPGQDILVDAPHLVSRYPSLLKGDHTKDETWNMTAKFDTFEKSGLDYELIDEFRFEKDHWLSRPAWFWNQISDSQKIKEVCEPWKREKTDLVFCEDSSRFYKRENCKEFVFESESPYIRRYVRGFEEIEYRPIVRFSL